MQLNRHPSKQPGLSGPYNCTVTFFFFFIKKAQIFFRVGTYYNILGSHMGSVHPQLLHITFPKSTLNITAESSHFPQPLLLSSEAGHSSLPPCTFSDTLTQETPLAPLLDPACWLCSNDSGSIFPPGSSDMPLSTDVSLYHNKKSSKKIFQSQMIKNYKNYKNCKLQ